MSIVHISDSKNTSMTCAPSTASTSPSTKANSSSSSVHRLRQNHADGPDRRPGKTHRRHIEIGGEDSPSSPRANGRLHGIPKLRLYPHMNVSTTSPSPCAHNAASSSSTNARSAKKSCIPPALLEIDMLLDRRPRQLPGGQRQRVAIARAMVTQRPCSCWMSRSQTSTPSCAPTPATNYGTFSARPISPPSSSPMTRSKPWAWAIASSSCPKARSSRSAVRSAYMTTPPTYSSPPFSARPA